MTDHGKLLRITAAETALEKAEKAGYGDSRYALALMDLLEWLRK